MMTPDACYQARVSHPSNLISSHLSCSTNVDHYGHGLNSNIIQCVQEPHFFTPLQSPKHKL
jgi:hypothetical protein